MLSFTDVTENSVTLNWTGASESSVAATQLVYLAFYTTINPGATAPTPAKVKASWTPVGVAAAVTTSVVSGLEAGTLYYFTVLVADPAQNVLVYKVASQETLAAAVEVDTSTSTTVLSTTTTASDSTTTTIVSDTTGPTVGNSGSLLATNVGTSTLTLLWTAATDSVLSQSALTYAIYASTDTAVVDTTAHITAHSLTPVATVVGGTGVISHGVTGLTLNSTYYFNVVVSNGLYTTAYTSTNQSLVSVETQAPVPGAGGNISATNIGTSTMTLVWAAATDTLVSQTQLTYTVYKSTYSNIVDNIANITTALGNNSNRISQVGSPTATTGTMTMAVTGLTASTPYYFNVVVNNGAYESAYSQLLEVTVGIGNVYLYTTSNSSTPGDFYASESQNRTLRQNLDAQCATNPNTSKFASLSSRCPNSANMHAVFSVSSGDTIATMPTTFNFGSAVVKDAMHAYQVAGNWNDLVTNGPCNGTNTVNGNYSSCNSTNTAQSLSLGLWALGGNNIFWSGAGAAGGLADNTLNCSNNGASAPWTDSGSVGQTGYLQVTGDPNTFNYVPGITCTNSYFLLCVCW